MFVTLQNFRTLVTNQFGLPFKAFQCDNGKEFDNSQFHTFLSHHGIHLSYHIHPKEMANRNVLRTLNNIVRSLLFQAYIPPLYWAEALVVATYLLNRRPS